MHKPELITTVIVTCKGVVGALWDIVFDSTQYRVLPRRSLQQSIYSDNMFEGTAYPGVEA